MNLFKKAGSFLLCFAMAVAFMQTFTIQPVHAASTNVAANRPSTSDSEQTSLGNIAMKASDNDSTTRWCANDSNTGHWLKIDLGTYNSLTGSEVMFEKSGVVYKYKIEISVDNVNWTLKVDKTSNTSTAQTQADSFTGTARYVRITVTGLPSGSYASIFEFRALGSMLLSNMALGKTISADSSQTANPASKANDNSTTTRWCANDAGTGHWLKVDLGGMNDVFGSEVMWEKSGVVYNYTVEISNDDLSWSTAIDKTANTATTQTQADAFRGSARYVRITVTGLPRSSYASIFEFRVLGVPAIAYHIDEPAGNYNVTVTLGSSSSAGQTSVLGETRRLMVPETNTASGALSTQTFTLNIRSPEGQPTGSYGMGTAGLDLLFGGYNPRYTSVTVTPAASPVMLYVIGDSTVCDQGWAPYTGWGQMITRYFKSGLSVANYGDTGESSTSFLSRSTLFPVVEKLLKTGDYVLIQLAHNDKTIDKETYQANLTSFVTRIRAKGAIPVFVTPMVRRQFTQGSSTLNSTALHVNSAGVDLPAAMKEVATSYTVPLIDLTTKSKVLVESLGPSASKAIYLSAAKDGTDDNTHLCAYGADQYAKFVIQGIQELGLPITSYIR